MIQISTRGRYSLRALVDVALHTDEGLVSRRAIAERQAISPDYTAQLFRQLRVAGLVRGVKGPGGGYLLARDAAEISAGDVIRAVEGPIAVAQCALPDEVPPCGRVDRCATHLLWKRLSETMTELLDSVSLQDLCDEARQLNQTKEGGNDESIQGYH